MLYACGEAPVRLFCAAAIIPGRLVGRMDAKMHRKTGVLEVISLYLEDDIRHGVSLQKESGRPLARLLLATSIARDAGTMSAVPV